MHSMRRTVTKTPVKYERDIVQVTSVIIILKKKWENKGTEVMG